MNGSEMELLRSGAAKLGVSLDPIALERFSTYLNLLQAWGKKFNLTTRLGTREIVVYHFLDSLAGVPVLAGTPTARVVDLGAGAGLPALPLKFALTGLKVVLVESVRKKIAFCQEAARAAGVADVTSVWGRGEDLSAQQGHHRAFDWAVSRALGAAADVARLALPFLVAGGSLLLYKGDPNADELDGLRTFCNEHEAVWELRRHAVPHLHAARSLIVVKFP